MKKLIVFVFLSISYPVFSADVKLDWDAPIGATGYKITMSLDKGLTWGTPIDIALVKPYTYLGVPEDKLVLFKVSAYNSGIVSWNDFAGAWYDHRMKLQPPMGSRVE